MPVYSANITKYNAGGSGDNYIADGYIKTVEKIWMDSYTFAQTGTNTTIHIASLPPNKKITSIECVIQSTISQTSGTVSIGYSVDGTDDLAPTGVSNFMAPVTITHNLTLTSIALPSPGLVSVAGPATVTSGTNVTYGFAVMGGFQGVTSGTQTTIAVKLNNWTQSSGSLKTIVRYV